MVGALNPLIQNKTDGHENLFNLIWGGLKGWKISD